MIQKISKVGWVDKIEVVKGNFAEDIVHKYLEERGYIVYTPTTLKAHGFDRLAVKDKKTFIIAEVKAKARLNKYQATGINIQHYLEYKDIQNRYRIPVFIFFVDEALGSIYGNFLKILNEKVTDHYGVCYPNTEIAKGIVLFSMSKMRRVSVLTNDQINYLKKNSNRNYRYNIKAKV